MREGGVLEEQEEREEGGGCSVGDVDFEEFVGEVKVEVRARLTAKATLVMWQQTTARVELQSCQVGR